MPGTARLGHHLDDGARFAHDVVARNFGGRIAQARDRAGLGRHPRVMQDDAVGRAPAPPFVAPIGSLRMIRIRVVGSGFLRHMVRGIAGTLMDVGLGKRAPECMAEILRTGNRELLGRTASAQGLWLEKVWYPNFDFESFASPNGETAE